MFDPQLLNTQFTDTDKLVLMKISDFLDCARRTAGGPKSKMKAARVKDLADQGIQFNQLPYLKLQDHKRGVKVIGHEGRHRSMLLRDLGYTHVPVILKHQEHDLDELPSRIVGEHGNLVKPAMLNYPYIQPESTQPFEYYD
jgi:hypothetical protein